MTASVLKQDPNAQKVQKNVIYYYDFFNYSSKNLHVEFCPDKQSSSHNINSSIHKTKRANKL